MNIQCAMVTDNAEMYVYQALVAMYSARKNTDAENQMTFHFLCSAALNEKSRNILKRVEEVQSNVKVLFHEVDDEMFRNIKTPYYVPVTTYYRLVCADVLDDIDKCIFLDSDVVVDTNLSELYMVVLDGFFFAGARDLYLISNPNIAAQCLKKYQISDFKNYINCGILVMNLAEIRSKGIQEQLYAEMKNDNLWMDQDVINRVCRGKIRILDWTWNHVTCFSGNSYKWHIGETSRENRGEIYHFCGPLKPYRNRYIPYAEIWWKAAEGILQDTEYRVLKGLSDLGDDYEKAYEIVRRCLNERDIIIIGYSNNGVRIYDYLRKCKIEGRIIYGDNDEVKRKLNMENVDVYSVKELGGKFGNRAIWINTVQNKREEIDEQLESFNIKKDRILEYYN